MEKYMRFKYVYLHLNQNEDRGNAVWEFLYDGKTIRLYEVEDPDTKESTWYLDYCDIMKATGMDIGLYKINLWNEVPMKYKALQAYGNKNYFNEEEYEQRDSIRLDGLKYLFSEDNFLIPEAGMFKDLYNLLVEMGMVEDGDEVCTAVIDLSDEDAEKFEKIFCPETKKKEKVDMDKELRDYIRKEIKKAMNKKTPSDPIDISVTFHYDEIVALYTFILRGPKVTVDFMGEREFYMPLGRAFKKLEKAWEEARKVPMSEALPALVRNCEVPDEI